METSAKLWSLLVYKRTALYDISNKLDSNRVYAAQAWKEMSQETKIEG